MRLIERDLADTFRPGTKAIAENGHMRAFASLTPRESEVLGRVARGMTNKEVAAILGVSAHTVRTQLEHVFEKLDVHTRTAAVAKAQAVLDAARS